MNENDKLFSFTCYTYEINGIWFGLCTDFNIRHVGESEDEVKDSLLNNVCFYLAGLYEIRELLNKHPEDKKTMMRKKTKLLFRISLWLKCLFRIDNTRKIKLEIEYPKLV